MVDLSIFQSDLVMGWATATAFKGDDSNLSFQDLQQLMKIIDGATAITDEVLADIDLLLEATSGVQMAKEVRKKLENRLLKLVKANYIQNYTETNRELASQGDRVLTPKCCGEPVVIPSIKEEYEQIMAGHFSIRRARLGVFEIDINPGLFQNADMAVTRQGETIIDYRWIYNWEGYSDLLAQYGFREEKQGEYNYFYRTDNGQRVEYFEVFSAFNSRKQVNRMNDFVCGFYLTREQTDQIIRQLTANGRLLTDVYGSSCPTQRARCRAFNLQYGSFKYFDMDHWGNTYNVRDTYSPE